MLSVTGKANDAFSEPLVHYEVYCIWVRLYNAQFVISDWWVRLGWSSNTRWRFEKCVNSASMYYLTISYRGAFWAAHRPKLIQIFFSCNIIIDYYYYYFLIYIYCIYFYPPCMCWDSHACKFKFLLQHKDKQWPLLFYHLWFIRWVINWIYVYFLKQRNLIKYNFFAK